MRCVTTATVELVGITIVNAKRLLDDAKPIVITIPERVTIDPRHLRHGRRRGIRNRRDAQDQAAIAHESIAVLGDDLNAAQLRTARALAEIDRVRAELHALRATRTFRYTASLRSIYGTLRRAFSNLAK